MTEHRTAGEAARLIDVRVLGPLEVVTSTGSLDLRHGRPRALFLALLVRAGEAVSADVLIDQLWPEQQPANAANALQVQVSYLRRQVRDLDDVRIARQGAGYCLAVDHELVDARRFEDAVEKAAGALPRPTSEANARALLDALDAALASWRGAPFVDAGQLTIVEADAARLEELRLVALEQRAELLAVLGRHAESAAVLQPLVAEHPLREGLWALLVTALYRSGRQAEALRAYGAARDHLVGELGIEPGPDLQAIERAVLDHDDVLRWRPLPGHGEQPAGPSAGAVAPPIGPDGPGRRRRAIPASISPLIGRRWEVDEVRNLIRDRRLVTLTGPGGVGKTRLAYEAAGDLGRPVEIAVVELAAVRDEAALPTLVAAAFPVSTVAGRDPLDAVCDRIGDDDWLLVLDNCEHVVGAAASSVALLLGQCPNLRVLATSRQPLGLAGELVWPVPFLEVPDEGCVNPNDVAAATAVRLFADRAKATNPRFEIDEGNAGAVAAICRTLDGLPLAIELAAARTGLLSPDAILGRLRDRFALLTSGGRDGSVRQHSLHATVAWSFDLLTEEEQRFFCGLGVFAGSFELPAAEFVCGPDGAGHPLDLLAGLVDQSLVVSDGADRYHLLDTLRAYALERIGEEVGPLRRRHAEWFRDLAVSADPYSHGPLPGGWPRLRADAANVRAALDWAFGPSGDPALGARMVGAVAGSLVLEGAFAELDSWLARADRVGGDDVTRATVCRGSAIVSLYQARFEEAVEAAGSSVRHAEAAGDDVLVASCLLPAGSAHWGTGDLHRSVAILRRAAALFDAAGDVRGRGFALARLSRSLTDLGDPTAVETATAAVDDLEASRDDWMGVVALDHLAYALLAAGDLEAAGSRAEQAVALADRVGSRSGRLAALGLSGRIRLAAGDDVGAVAAHVDAVTSAVRINNPGSVVANLGHLAHVRMQQGAAFEAAVLLGCADAVRGRSGLPFRAEDRERLRAELGDAKLEGATRAGRKLSPVDAIAGLTGDG